MINYKPLGSRVIVRIISKTEVKIAGQTLTIARGVNKYGSASKEWEDTVLSAEVIKVGPDSKDIAGGDVVILPGYAGKWIDSDIAGSAETHRIVDEADILAIDEDATAKLRQQGEPVNA